MSGAAAAAVACGVLAVASSGEPSGPATHPTPSAAEPSASRKSALRRTSYFNSYKGSQYHVYADGIDWSATIGIVYFFDGDYFTKRDSNVYHPHGSTMRRMAESANHHNIVLVAPITPAESGSAGYTWWQHDSKNAAWFRSFSAMVENKLKVSDGNIWFMGYSGGAEFISVQILAERQAAYGSGGAIMLGGGGKPETYDKAPKRDRQHMRLAWIVGDEDVAGQTYPYTWSAYSAAHEGRAFYKSKGFQKTSMTVLSDKGHLDYDLAAVLEYGLRRG